MPSREKKSPKVSRNKKPKAPPKSEFHIDSALIGGNRFLEVSMTNFQQGIVIGDGPDPPEEKLPADIVVHGPQGPMVINAQSTSPTMITGEGSIDELHGRLVHRPGGAGKLFGFAGGKSKTCEACGFAGFMWQKKCPKGHKLA
jgi:hypothetical protein